MIPVLYEATETAFTSNGLGRLADCISCKVREVRNGEYVLTMQYPVTGSLYSEIKVGRRITAIHDDKHDVQPFIVYGHSKPINGVVTFYAWHLSYLLKYVVVKPFTASTCAAAIAAMKSQAYGENKFNFWTDKSVSATYKNQHPASVRSLLAGEENSLLDVYGTGEYEFDKWTVKLHLHRGSNKGVSIRYGVNLTSLQQDVDSQEVYNAVAPYWTNGETGAATTLPEGFVLVGTPQTTIMPWTDNNGNYMTDNNGNLFEFRAPDLRVHPLDLTDRFETQPTADQLRAAAISAASSSAPWLPTENIKLSYANDGSEFEPLMSVCLCDEISVYCGPLGVSATSMEVVSLEYDTLNERNVSVEVGVLKSSFADTIRKATLSSAMAYANAIAAAKTNTLDLSLTQQEIFDRLTDGGLEQGLALESTTNPGPSAAGDKKLYLNLDYARFGKLVADFIQGGTLRLGGLDNADGVLEIRDANGNVIGTWNNAGISVNSGQIVFSSSDATGDGTLTISEVADMAFNYRWNDIASGYSYYLRLYADTLVMENETLNSALLLTNDRVYIHRTSASETNHPRFAMLDEVTGKDVELSTDYGLLMQNYSNGNYTIVGRFSHSGISTTGNLTVSGTKSRTVATDQYADRLLYCYETPTPMFGDVGEGEIGEDGLCYIWLDPVFAQTIATSQYQVFLQPYGSGTCWVDRREGCCFVVRGEPGMKFGWEIKAKQKGYDQRRLERDETPFEVPEQTYGADAAQYIEDLKKGRVTA